MRDDLTMEALSLDAIVRLAKEAGMSYSSVEAGRLWVEVGEVDFGDELEKFARLVWAEAVASLRAP